MTTATATEKTAVPSAADQAKEIAELKAQLKALADKPDYSGVRRDEEGRLTSQWEATDEEIGVVTPVGFRNDARRAYKSLRQRSRAELKGFGYTPWNEFKSFSDFVRTGFGSDKFLSRLETHCKAIQGMSVSDGSGGGVTVVPEFAPGIIDRVYGNNLWSLTDNYAVSGNNITFTASAETSRATGSRAGGIQGYWMNEGGAITKSKPTLREVTLKLNKLAAVVYLTQELLDDTGVALEQYVSRKVAEEFNFMIGDGLFNGTGVGQLLGILNAPSLVSIAKETGQEAATILPENVVKMYSRFYAANLPRSQWFHNQDIGPQLDLMTLGIGAAGIAVYMPPNGLADAPFGTLRGRPMQPTEFNATLGTQGDLVLADFGQVLSISKGGVAQAVSMHVEFVTDQLALRFVMRIAAQPWENAPITPYKGTANTQSNFVALDTRA